MPALRRPTSLTVVTLLLLLLGGLALESSRRTEQRWRQVPTVTCRDLLPGGPPLPQYVRLSDAHLGGRGHAARRDMDAALEMYVPVYSGQLGAEPAGAELRLVLEVLDDDDRARLLADPAPAELIVEVLPGFAQLPPWCQRRLGTLYPGWQAARCRLVRVGLWEPTAWVAQRQRREAAALWGLAVVLQILWPFGQWLAWRSSWRAVWPSSATTGCAYQGESECGPDSIPGRF